MQSVKLRSSVMLAIVLLAQDNTSLQKMLEILHEYYLEWELYTVNMGKTATMVFNRSGQLLNESRSFVYGDVKIPSVCEYCYLGITFTLNGSLNIAQQKLKQKGLRSYFAKK